jgi:thioredoxin-related protein
MHSARRSLLLLALLFALTSFVTAPPACAVEWLHWNAGLEAARASGRPILVDVYTDWCGWCKRMDADVFAKPDVSGYLASHFVTVRLNAESGELATWQGRNYSARSLASTFNVSGYPTQIFLTSAGDHLANVPGYQPRERFLLLLRYVGDGHMARNEGWDDYVKQAQGDHPQP